MNKLVFLLIFLSVQIFAEADFSAFQGSWRGDCINTSSGLTSGSSPLLFKMYLDVQKKEPLAYSWKMTYVIDEKKQVRDYSLLVDKSLNGSFIIDESNGLLLAGQLFHNILYQLFSLKNGPILFTRYELNGNFLNVEIPTFSTKSPLTTTTLDFKNTVYSYNFTGLQKCQLEKE